MSTHAPADLPDPASDERALPHRFSLIAGNPPYQDRTRRGRTPHKLWIEFTEAALTDWLAPDGTLIWVTPASFRSPNSRILELMRTRDTASIDLDAGAHFPGVGSSFAAWHLVNRPATGPTSLTSGGHTAHVRLSAIPWLPTDTSAAGLSIAAKTLWSDGTRLDVRHDYATCHNTKLGTTLSRTRTRTHRHPVLHTNRQTWWSSVRQDWAATPKVIWSRSGYTRPVADHGRLGGTDMAYYVPVATNAEADTLAHNLALPLVAYLLDVHRWSGFGNERVFAHLPALPVDRRLTSSDLNALFGLSAKEARHVDEHLA